MIGCIVGCNLDLMCLSINNDSERYAGLFKVFLGWLGVCDVTEI